MKKLSRCLILTILVLMIFTVTVMAENNSIKVFINGKVLDDDVLIISDRTLAPIRSIYEGLGFAIEHIEQDGRVSIKKNNRSIEFTIDSNKAKVDGREVELDVEPFVKDSKIFVPLRFIAENLGDKVVWDEKNKIVLIGEFSGEAEIENTFLYFNDEYGYTLNFPNSWKEEAIIKTENGVLYVYDKETAEKFMEDGVDNFGPVFEIRGSEYPVVANLPYEGDYLLGYRDGMYFEVLFCRDFQFYPETQDSYVKISNEAKKALGSFKMVNEETFVEDDNKNHIKEIDLLHDVLDNYVPQNIFNRDEIYSYKNPVSNTSFLYMREKNDEEVLIKIEALFNKDKELIQYHLKSYGYDLVKNKLSQSDGLGMANRFIDKYLGESIEVIKKPDLYPSLYEKNKHETYGDKDGNYVVVVDLEHGFVEYFKRIDN